MKRCMAILVLSAAAVVILIAAINRTPEPPARTLDDVITQTGGHVFLLMTPESELEQAALDRFRDFWRELSVTGIQENIAHVYDDTIWFNDTLKTIENLDALKKYMLQTHDAVDTCTVDFLDMAYSSGNYYARWKMTVTPKGASPDAAWVSTGMTHLRFNQDGRVVLHQDYWDAAGGLYEHLPVVGWLLRNIRARI